VAGLVPIVEVLCSPDRGRRDEPGDDGEWGEFVYVPRGTIHRNQNVSANSARAIELNITDKDKPQTEPVAD